MLIWLYYIYSYMYYNWGTNKLEIQCSNTERKRASWSWGKCAGPQSTRSWVRLQAPAFNLGRLPSLIIHVPSTGWPNLSQLIYTSRFHVTSCHVCCHVNGFHKQFKFKQGTTQERNELLHYWLISLQCFSSHFHIWLSSDLALIHSGRLNGISVLLYSIILPRECTG